MTHLEIIRLLRERLQDSDPEIKAMGDEQFLRILFYDFRGSGNAMKGFRLTRNGYKILRPFYQGHRIKIDLETLGPRELIFLSRTAKLPYFIDTDAIVAFDSDFGLNLTMCGGDVRRLAEISGDAARN